MSLEVDFDMMRVCGFGRQEGLGPLRCMILMTLIKLRYESQHS